MTPVRLTYGLVADPVNFHDPEGLLQADPSGYTGPTGGALGVDPSGMCNAEYSYEQCGGGGVFWGTGGIAGVGYDGSGGGVSFGNSFATTAGTLPAITICMYTPGCQVVLIYGVPIAIGGYTVVQIGTWAWNKYARKAPPPGIGRPKDGVPTGTKPIDQLGWGSDRVHDVKDGIGAGPRDWSESTLTETYGRVVPTAAQSIGALGEDTQTTDVIPRRNIFEIAASTP